MATVIDRPASVAYRPGRRQLAATILHRAGMTAGLTILRSALIRDLRILAYHRVLTIEDEHRFDFDLDLVSASEHRFREQMELVARRFNAVRFRDVVEAGAGGKALPPRPVIVTFDDGYDDNFRCAFPILHTLGVPATFFVSTGHIDSGRAFAYDWLVHMICRSTASHLRIPELDLERALPDTREARRELAAGVLDCLKWRSADEQAAVIARLEDEWRMPRDEGHADCRPMTWDQLREMQAAGMEIGSHGVWHHMLAKLPVAGMREEVDRSKATLDRELGTHSDVLSYPVGGVDAYDDAVIEAARNAGFRLACTYTAGSNRLPLRAPYALRRLPVERYMDRAWFAGLLGLPEMFSYPSRRRIG